MTWYGSELICGLYRYMTVKVRLSTMHQTWMGFVLESKLKRLVPLAAAAVEVLSAGSTNQKA
jgi:hypothetical protein